MSNPRNEEKGNPRKCRKKAQRKQKRNTKEMRTVLSLVLGIMKIGLARH
jgi:cytoskeletal protein RodZ